MSTATDVKVLADWLATHDQATTGAERRTERINVRARESELNLLRYAASVKGRTLSEFLMETAIASAEQVIEQRAHVVMSKKDFEAFAEDLDAEPHVIPMLAKVAARYRSV